MNKIRVIDLLNKIANGEEVPKRIRYKLFELDRTYSTDIKTYYVDKDGIFFFKDYSYMLNDEVEIIEEDKIIVEDKEGNKKEYFIKLNGGLKEGEKIFKQDNEWYVQKLLSPESEFYKWIEQFKPEIYYTLEDKTIEEDKKIEKLENMEVKSCIDGRLYSDLTIEELARDVSNIVDKINEIIDKMNKE